MNSRFLLLAVFLGLFLFAAKAQNVAIHPTTVRHGNLYGITPPLRDLPVMTAADYQEMERRAKSDPDRNEKLQKRSFPHAATALPIGPDPAWQHTMGSTGDPKAPLVNFDGQTSPYYPPDCNGAAGPNHYMQTINCVYAIYSKTGTLMAGPTNMNTLFTGLPGATYNDGDPIVLYDEQADRWLACEFSISGSTNYMLMAVSTTNDPTGTWFKYSFVVNSMPDYPKFSVWRDGYYMGDNNSSTNDIYVFERSQMIIGGASPQSMGFNNAWRPTSVDGFMCVPPVDNDGAFAPAGSPGLFIAFNDDAVGGGADELWVYELAVNWTTPASSTFTRTQQIAVQSFDSNFGNGWNNIAQQGTTQKVDAIPQVIMNVPQYRNFGSYQTIVCCHTVDVDATDHAGVRWYELRKTTGTWSVRQQGTYAPDANSRWMGSIMLNGSGKLALGYSVSSSTMYPAIRYCGQSAGAYSSATGVMDIPEDVIIAGTASQTGANRWGDYSLMSVDPSDDNTFWFTDEYIGSGGTRKTRIASFKFGNSPTVTTLAAAPVALTTATLNGSLNPNGLATTYHFEWGTTVSYGTNTTTASAGAGSTSVAVNAPISSLVAGTTYHFRLVGVNTDGTVNGADMTFTPGAAMVTTTAASAITLTTATAGGNVTSDGGSSVTARGVCWSTTANPTIAGSHTTNGTGTGVFTSSLTGLVSNTTYHLRAYATNSAGTYYGADVPFTTLCGIYSLPFSESFSGTTIPGCWSQVDHQANGFIWQFGTITSQSPNPVLTGNYAYLDSDAYGSGNTENADLVTPTLDLTAFSAVVLQFNHYFKSYSGSSGTVSYSIDGGTTWTQIQQFTTTSATNPLAFSQNVNATAGHSAVKFRWNYTGTFGYSWAIDDVQITGTGGVALAVTPPNQNVTPPAGTTPFTVTTPASWTAVSNATAWCTVTPSGTGNGTITATYQQNTTATPRVATITVSASGAPTQTVTVTQSGVAPTLAVTPPNQNVPAPMGTTTFTVASNSDWAVISDASWCVVTAAGTGNGTITANYAENTSVATRIANITVTVSGLGPQVVTVTQSGGAPTIAVSPPNQNVNAPAGSTNFTVTSNANWNVTSDANWCTPTASGFGNGNIAANFTENTAITARVANLTVTVTGVTPIIVTVTQSGTGPFLGVAPPNQNVNYVSGSTNFTVTSNATWTALSNMSWCTVTPSGSGNGSIIADYTENVATSPRVANIQVTVSGLPVQTVTVSQDGYVGMNEQSAGEFRIYPNPTKGIFRIVPPQGQTGVLNVAVCDMNGQVILKKSLNGEKEYFLDLSNTAEGCYQVMINTGTEVIMKKLVIIK